jgi:hypothetical protein
MTEMVIGTFLDKEHQPTMREIFASIGAKRKSWERLAQFIADNYRIRGDLAFYGKNYGWASRFRKGGKVLASIYPGKDSFTVQIVLGETLVEKASGLKLGRNVRKVLENAHQFPEGRWLFIRIESQQDITDVQQLLVLKARPLKNWPRPSRDQQ